MTKQFMDMHEVKEALGVSESKSYEIIRILNKQLKAQGYITIPGKVNRTFFEEKCCYGGVKVEGE